MRSFPLDFIRQTLEQTLTLEHQKNPNYIGGSNQLALCSFYEQLVKQDELDRYVALYRDIIDQQNRSDLIANGTILSPNNPSYINLNQKTIIPLQFNCNFRVRLENRDELIDTFSNMIRILKGRKVDIAELDNGKLFMVGTLGNNSIGAPLIKNGDYIGTYANNTLSNSVRYKYLELANKGFVSEGKMALIFDNNMGLGTTYSEITKSINFTCDGVDYTSISFERPTSSQLVIKYGDTTVRDTIGWVNQKYRDIILDNLSELSKIVNVSGIKLELQNHTFIGNNGDYFYYEDINNHTLSVAYCNGSNWNKITDDFNSYPDILFPSEHNSFTKYTLSLSFDSFNCDTPKTLNAKEYCNISFSGSASLSDASIKHGNEMTKLSISKYLIKAQTPISLNGDYTFLEPLELPNNSNANTINNLLYSNRFINNTHTDNLSLVRDYTFAVDDDISLIKEWFNYARYGTQTTTIYGISPNMIYKVREYWCKWGVVELKESKTKISGDIEMTNTDDDILTIKVSMQVQGDND